MDQELELKLKNEIEDIMNRVEAILKKIETSGPAGNKESDEYNQRSHKFDFKKSGTNRVSNQE